MTSNRPITRVIVLPAAAALLLGGIVTGPAFADPDSPTPAPRPQAAAVAAEIAAETVTVRFLPLKGKLAASQRVRVRAVGARLGKLPVPKRRHHIFLGWARGSAGGRFVSAKTRAWTDLVLHAVWAKRGSHATWRAGNTMKLHARPRAHSRLAAIVKRGTKVAIVARHGHWYRLRASKHRAGWVRLCYAAKGL